MRPARLLGAVLLAGYVVALLLALFSPSSQTQDEAVGWLGRQLAALGVPDDVTQFGPMERLANVLIVAPVTFLGALLLPRLGWRDWTAFGFLAALLVELVQVLALPDRHGSTTDVVANTTGALMGAVLAAGLLAALPARRREAARSLS